MTAEAQRAADLDAYRKINGGADIDDTGRYRYRLWRYLTAEEDGPAAIFIMLNPSTADGHMDDPTIRRCKSFAHAWGRGLLIVVNLYAYRATDPADLRAAWRREEDIVGPGNDDFLRAELATKDAVVVAAWGAVPAWMMPRVRTVEEIAREVGIKLQALATTKSGQPRHPLYLPNRSTLCPWSAP